MKYAISFAGTFKKSKKLCKERGFDIKLLDEIIERIANRETLEPKYHDHQLVGQKKYYRECHIKPDWLLIYLANDEEQLIILVDTGTHSDLF